MPEVSERVQLVTATFTGIKDTLFAAAAIASIFYGVDASGKLDVQAAKTEQVKESLAASTEARDKELAIIAEDAKAAARKAEEAANNVANWRATYEKPREPSAVAPPP